MFALLGGPACLTKLFWTIAYSMLKESCKNIQPFSCSYFPNNPFFLNGRGPATPLMTPTKHWPFTCELSLCILTQAPTATPFFKPEKHRYLFKFPFYDKKHKNCHIYICVFLTLGFESRQILRLFHFHHFSIKFSESTCINIFH